MINADIRKVIEDKAAKYGIDPDLVEAFCMVESSGIPDVDRYEPLFRHRYIDKLKLDEEESRDRATSFGLMQIMGQVARELGFKGQFSELYTPEIGLEYSLKHLARFIKKYAAAGLDYAIAAYNAGTPQKHGGIFVNQGYVDKVKKEYRRIKAK